MAAKTIHRAAFSGNVPKSHFFFGTDVEKRNKIEDYHRTHQITDEVSCLSLLVIHELFMLSAKS